MPCVLKCDSRYWSLITIAVRAREVECVGRERSKVAAGGLVTHLTKLARSEHDPRCCSGTLESDLSRLNTGNRKPRVFMNTSCA